ncbi:MAG: hypothetical protein WCI88_15255 [Chloroflexota bacterium]
MERAVSLLVDWLVEPDFNELRRAFFEWLSREGVPPGSLSGGGLQQDR